MNLLRILPSFLRESYEKAYLGAGIKNFEKYYSTSFLTGLLISLVLSTLTYFIGYNPFLVFIILFVLMQIFFYFRVSLKASSRLKKIEEIFPDVIQLMSSNLRAGMTIDKAFLLSSRPEFSPLDEEIMKTGKEITTGKDVAFAFMEMGKRINSDKIDKTIRLIMSGLKAGGNISTLLEQTASNMREKEFIEKRAASNILMYVIFIFFAVAVGAPVLFGLSSVLVEIIVKIGGTLPAGQTTQLSLPITFSKVSISSSFIIYFSILFLTITGIISSLVIGLVNKGSAKTGLRYTLPLIAVSIVIFFLVRIVLSGFFQGALPTG